MNEKHVVSCFEGSLNGWYKDSPEKTNLKQATLLHQLQQNLNRYQDENNRLSKQRNQKHQVEHVRLPLLSNARSNINLQIRKPCLSKGPKFQSQLGYKKITPLRMKTIMLYNSNENNCEQNARIGKRQKKMLYYDQNKDKYRKKVIVNFQRIKEIGGNMLQFSDDKFFRDSLTLQQKSKSVKLHMLGR